MRSAGGKRLEKKPVTSRSLTSSPWSQRAKRIMSYLGQVGGLPNAIDATESDHVGSAMTLGVHDITEYIHTALGLQDLHESLLQGLLHR